MKERLRYIDVAKGMLIILVIIRHLPQLSAEYGISNNLLVLLKKCSPCYLAFFMPAFFLVTGYCTDFHKSTLTQFFIRQFKSIMIPAFCLGAVSIWISLIAKGCGDLSEYCKIGIRTFIFQGGAFWFLSALFIAKNLLKIWYLIMSKLKIEQGKKSFLLTFAFCLFLLGLACFFQLQGIVNVWYFQHAFSLIVFLFVGQLFKYFRIEKTYLLCSFLYVIAILYYYVFRKELPYITAGFHVTFLSIIPYLVLAVLGSILCIYVSIKVNKNRFLEFLGKNSLLIYTLHIAVMTLILNVGKKTFGMSVVCNNWFTVLYICFIILVLMILVRFFNLKYLRFLLGKFN